MDFHRDTFGRTFEAGKTVKVTARSGHDFPQYIEQGTCLVLKCNRKRAMVKASNNGKIYSIPYECLTVLTEVKS